MLIPQTANFHYVTCQIRPGCIVRSVSLCTIMPIAWLVKTAAVHGNGSLHVDSIAHIGR